MLVNDSVIKSAAGACCCFHGSDTNSITMSHIFMTKQSFIEEKSML